MATVAELLPGDLVSQGGMSAVFITHCQHPIWPDLRLVIWRLDDGGWSHDALRHDQEVGVVQPGSQAELAARLREALLHNI